MGNNNDSWQLFFNVRQTKVKGTFTGTVNFHLFWGGRDYAEWNLVVQVLVLADTPTGL